MSRARTAATSTAAAVLVGLATPEVVGSFRLAVALLVAVLLVVGQRWDVAPITGAGLLALVVVVGAGAAGAAGPVGLLAWGTATWAVVLLAAAGSDVVAPPARDTRTRLRLVASELAVVAAAVPLVVVAGAVGRVPAVWAAVGGAVAVSLLVLALRASAVSTAPQGPLAAEPRPVDEGR